jgi:uncharacterized protein YabN with tetrapyrrole methylase and pyrophosphatase domain
MSYIPALASISKNLPPLERAYALLGRASDEGFKWPNAQFVLKKIQEELTETEEAIAEGNKEHVAEEIGDVLSAAVNLARFVSVDIKALSLQPRSMAGEQAIAHIRAALQSADAALTHGGNMVEPIQRAVAGIASLAHSMELDAGACLVATNEKFAARFSAVEAALLGQGRTMATTPLKEMIDIWNQQKNPPSIQRT